MPQLFANNATTTLSAGVSATDAILPVTTTAKLPNPRTADDWYFLTITNAVTETAWEVVRVVYGGTGNNLRVLRGQDGTTAQAWSSGSIVEVRPVAGTMAELTAPGTPRGFLGGFQYFPGTANFTTAKNTAAAAAHPWMRGARFWLAEENLCQVGAPTGATWDTDISNLNAAVHPFDVVMPRLSFSPSATWDITLAATTTYMDAVVAGCVNVMNAAKTRDVMIDPENYATATYAFNFGQGGNGLYNPGSLTRAQMAVKMQDFGRQVGLSLWSRIPNARVHMLFAATQVLQWTGTPSGTQAPSSQADSGYATDSYYNLLPYFCLGLLDACPPTGRIIDYCETGLYGFAGLAALKRVLWASKNWVQIFFPQYTGLVAKSAECWVAVPIIYPDCHFIALGTWYAGANFVTATADRIAHFTRNALYALQATPPGYLPMVYTDQNGYSGGRADPWGQFGSVVPMDSTVQTCLNNALALYNGSTTWAALGLNPKSIYTMLMSAFSTRTDYQWECQ